jgi:hypothetical protein
MNRVLPILIFIGGWSLAQSGLKNATVHPVNLTEYLKAASEKLNCDLADLKIDPADLDFYGYGRYRLKTFDFIATEPLKAEPFMQVTARTLLSNADSLWFLAYYPWARIDEGVRRGLVERPENRLRDSLAKTADARTGLKNLLIEKFGVLKPDLSPLSDSLARGLWLVLEEMTNSLEWINKGVAGLTRSELDSVVNGLTSEQEDGMDNRQLERMIEKTDFKALAAGAMDLGYVLPVTADFMKNFPARRPLLIETKYGKLAIGTETNDKYDRGPYLLIIDFGGDDEYVDCPVTDKTFPISIVIDYAGNDEYHGRCGPATGVAGYAVVLDREGDDSYTSDRVGLATGIFGLGLILDCAGDDFYSGDLYAEGAGLFGGGVLTDLKGNDEYACFQGGQGFGFVKGCGILIDREGDDTYVARDDTVKYPSPQTGEHNASLAQGMGYGIRADYLDGHSLAGGVGILADGQGNDRYSCGVFGQGCGYWYGAGFLIDMLGDDEYNGTWYAQGSGAHFAFGGLLDSCGNDRHTLQMSMGLGAGHDFTLGCLFDYAGDDYYEGGGLSLGAGNANGMGLFADFQGDDTYQNRDGNNLGFATIASRGGLRDYMKCIGLFFDGGGNDKYGAVFAGDRKFWIQKPTLEPVLKTERFIGIDF